MLPNFAHARREYYVSGLAISETHRRQYLASAMFERRKIRVIFAQADCVNEPAVALYAKFGQHESVLHCDNLPGGADV